MNFKFWQAYPFYTKRGFFNEYVSEDPYHTEFVSWRVDHFSFFYFISPRGGGQTLSGNKIVRESVFSDQMH